MSPTPALGLHPDRLLPSEPGLRSAARRMYDSVKDLPIISPHGHVPARWLADDMPATTDDPCDDLAAHRFLRGDGSWQGRVIPTFRPDRYLQSASPSWNVDVDRLDAGFVAQLVVEHRLGDDEALEVMHDLVVTNPRRAFKL